MIIVNIKNGLGNQMFQYAFGKVLEWKYEIPVYFDLLRDDITSPLKSDLDVFRIESINEAKPEWRKPFLPFSVRQYIDKKQYIRYIYYKLRRKYQKNKLITEPYPSQYMSVFDTLDPDGQYYFLGFWQNPTYFLGFEPEIRNLFLPIDSSVYETAEANEIQNSRYDTVSLHFRRGDYLTSGFIEPINDNYYEHAISIMASKLKNPFFYIFSDEPEWVKENFKLDYPSQIITGNSGADAYKDILLMSKCKHNIMANSTFSWWGAWLNENPDKIVTAPKKWYASAERDRYTNNITPKQWIRL